MYELKEFGSFYIGGKIVTDPHVENKTAYRGTLFPAVSMPKNSEFVIEQAYVQYFFPKNKTQELPLILLHGGGHTGAIWENTPDGRKGWLHYFIQQGYVVYCMDNIERGRSGWCSISGIWEGEPELRSMQDHQDLFRLDKTKQYETSDLFAVARYTVPRWRLNRARYIEAITNLIKKVGKCNIVAHSESCSLALEVMVQNPQLIHSLVLIEPSDVPKIDDVSVFFGKQLLFIYGDFIEHNDLWKKIREKVKDFYSLLIKNNANATWCDLPMLEITGNSHLIMVDKNNLEVATIINAWIKSPVNLEQKLSCDKEITILKAKL